MYTLPARLMCDLMVQPGVWSSATKKFAFYDAGLKDVTNVPKPPLTKDFGFIEHGFTLNLFIFSLVPFWGIMSCVFSTCVEVAFFSLCWIQGLQTQTSHTVSQSGDLV